MPADANRKAVAVEPPRDPSHGDLATNAAMVLAKAAGTNPRALAELIEPKLEALPSVTAVEIAGPGFINLRLATDSLARRADDDPRRGRATMACRRSARTSGSMSNMSRPTRPGRCTWAIAAARWSATRSRALLEAAGFRVTKEYYVNDAGAQVDTLARSAHLRYREALGEDIGEIPEGLYPGRLSEAGRRDARRRISATSYVGAPESEWLRAVQARRRSRR